MIRISWMLCPFFLYCTWTSSFPWKVSSVIELIILSVLEKKWCNNANIVLLYSSQKEMLQKWTFPWAAYVSVYDSLSTKTRICKLGPSTGVMSSKTGFQVNLLIIRQLSSVKKKSAKNSCFYYEAFLLDLSILILYCINIFDYWHSSVRRVPSFRIRGHGFKPGVDDWLPLCY